MKKIREFRDLIRVSFIFVILACFNAPMPKYLRPGHPDWPVGWLDSAADFVEADRYQSALIHCIPVSNADTSHTHAQTLKQCKKNETKMYLTFPELQKFYGENPDMPALLIGGSYEGLAIDRHVFRFSPNIQFATILPPKIVWAFPYFCVPVKAEVVVPLAPYDGCQHLYVIPAALSDISTTRQQCYRMQFDLRDLEGALLSQVGLTVYWKMFHLSGDDTIAVPAIGPGLIKAMQSTVTELLSPWQSAGQGMFPVDIIPALKLPDAPLMPEGAAKSEDFSCPIWDYSEAGLAAYSNIAGTLEFPRTLGHPEIYGSEAYALWIYSRNKTEKTLYDSLRAAVQKIAPDLIVMQNATASHPSYMDGIPGIGLEMQADAFNAILFNDSDSHLSEAFYYSGLARRHDKILLPQIQGLQLSSFDHLNFIGADAVMWNLPVGVPSDSVISRMRTIHQSMKMNPPAKVKPDLAVLRFYEAASVTCLNFGFIRNPADWLLFQCLSVWSDRYRRSFDVFEIPPGLSLLQKVRLDSVLAQYPYHIANQPYDDAWNAGALVENKIIHPDQVGDIQDTITQRFLDMKWIQEETAGE